MSSIRRDISTGEVIIEGPKGQTFPLKYRDPAGKWRERHEENGYRLKALRAYGRLAYTGQPTDAETVQIGSTTFTAKNTPVATTDFQIGGDMDTTYANLTAKILELEPSVTPTHSAPGNYISLDASVPGSAGNSITLSSSLSNTTATVPSGGTDGLWANRVYNVRFRASLAFVNSLPLTGFQLIPAVGEKNDPDGFGIRLVSEPRCFVIGATATGLGSLYLEGFNDDSTWKFAEWNLASLTANNDGVPSSFESIQRTYRTTDSGFPIYLKKSGGAAATSVAFDFVLSYVIDRGTVS